MHGDLETAGLGNITMRYTFVRYGKWISVGFLQQQQRVETGGPPSPYLFTLVMDFSIISLELEIARGAILPRKGKGFPIFHLIFVDDLVFYKGIVGSFKKLEGVFYKFAQYAGLLISKDEQAILNSFSFNKDALSAVLGIAKSTLPTNITDPHC